MDIAFIGIGNVGSALAGRLADLGHDITIAARDPDSNSVRTALSKTPKLKVKTTEEAVASAEIVFLATPFQANKAALKDAGDLSGKLLVDCTNPIGSNLTHGLNHELSGGEYVQNLVPAAKVVKAFSIYGFENFENNTYPGYGALNPVMLIAGNDSGAKQMVCSLCTQLGWDPVDTGDISMSLHLEHMTLLWIKMGRLQRHDPGFVWAMLRRE